MGIFKNPSTPISKLNMSNFEEFATDYAQYAFELAYKCVPKVENATGLAISALSRVVCVEAAEPGSDQIGAETGIQRAMNYFLSKTQRERLLNDSIRTDSSVFSFDIGEQIIDGAVEKAKRDMPRYAPVFSGISGTMLILMLVALIVAAIVFIWINPFKGRFTDNGGVSGSDIIYSTPAARLNSQLMLDVESDVSCTDARGNAFTSGLPVNLSVTGIDADDSLSVSVTGDNGRGYSVYQTDSGKYCFVADSNQIYNVKISNTGGASVSHYVSVYQLDQDFDNKLSVPFCAIKSSGESIVSPFTGAQGIQAVSEASLSGGEIPGGVSVSRVPVGCSVMVSQDKRTLTFNGGGTTGIDSMDITVTDADNRTSRYTVPVIIADNVPVISPASREISIKHTPSKAGTYAGRISAVDADGDDVTYALDKEVNCSVMMSPSGAFIVRAAEEFGGSEATFSVTASDGCITSSPVDIHVKLNNGLVSTDNYKFSVVCMSKGDGYYPLPLPAVDDDGDPITWSIFSPENGQTDNAYVSIDNGALIYRMFENVNRDYTDTVQLYCTDGWTTGTPIPFDIVCRRNQPPVQSGANRYTMRKADGSIQITVELSNDNAEDVCVIDELISCTGGDVRQDDNWRNLTFTFVPDGTQDICNVRLRVRENGGDNTAVVEYNIIIE